MAEAIRPWSIDSRDIFKYTDTIVSKAKSFQRIRFLSRCLTKTKDIHRAREIGHGEDEQCEEQLHLANERKKTFVVLKL
jgi:hypothetical protein